MVLHSQINNASTQVRAHKDDKNWFWKGCYARYRINYATVIGPRYFLIITNSEPKSVYWWSGLRASLWTMLYAVVDSLVHAIHLSLPEFWPNQAAVWLAQAKAQFALKNISVQQSKFYYVVSALPQQVISSRKFHQTSKDLPPQRLPTGWAAGGSLSSVTRIPPN